MHNFHPAFWTIMCFIYIDRTTPADCLWGWKLPHSILITLKLYHKRDTTVDIVIILTTRSVFLYYTVWNTELSRTSNVSMKKRIQERKIQDKIQTWYCEFPKSNNFKTANLQTGVPNCKQSSQKAFLKYTLLIDTKCQTSTRKHLP